MENHYPPFETSLGIDFSVLGQFSCHMVFTYQLESQRMEAFTQENCNVLLIKNVWISSGVPLRLQQIDTEAVFCLVVYVYIQLFFLEEIKSEGQMCLFILGMLSICMEWGVLWLGLLCKSVLSMLSEGSFCVVVLDLGAVILHFSGG